MICATAMGAASALVPLSAQACKYEDTALAAQLRRFAETCGHVLCGSIHPSDPDVLKRGTSCDGDPLIALTADWLQARFSGAVVIGEVHDNASQHEVQANLLRSDPVPSPEDKAAIVFEQVRSDQQSGLDQFALLQTRPAAPATLAEFKRLTNWDTSGWQQYNYDPLLQAAIDLQLPLYAGDVPRATMMKVAKEGEAALPSDERARLKLDVPLGEANDAASLATIEENHCGLMPKEALKPMAYAQRYRDAHLADATLNAAERHGSAILITGNEHARTDRGAPWYIRQRAPDKKVVSVMLIEVEAGKTDPEAYVPRGPDGKPAADYIIFTPAAPHEDQCAKMRERMQKKK